MTTIPQRPVALFILDGYGLNPEAEGNAILAADTPNLDRLAADYPTTRIFTSGLDVGLPDGQMGNSEVGHTNIGAGRIVYQDLTRITKSIEDGDFFSNSAFRTAIRNCQENDRALHLLGLISDGGVHSHNTHLYALLRLAKEVGLTKVFIHCFYDGRDVPPDSAKGYTEELVAEMAAIGVGKSPRSRDVIMRWIVITVGSASSWRTKQWSLVAAIRRMILSLQSRHRMTPM